MSARSKLSSSITAKGRERKGNYLIRLNFSFYFHLPIFKLSNILVFYLKQIIPPGNLHQMALQEVKLSTSGKYTCQITLDAPPFQFTSRSGNMTVISIPERFPVIDGNKGHQNYRLGERVQLNCTCYDTHPPANLRWFINDRQVSFN